MTPQDLRLGTCPHCGRRIRLTVQGALWGHGTEPWTEATGFSARCPGGYGVPVAEPVA